MFSIRLTRNIQRYQRWARFKSSSTAASIDIGTDGKKAASELSNSTEPLSGGFSKQLFSKLKTMNPVESGEGTSESGERPNRTNRIQPNKASENLNLMIAKATTLNDLLAIADKPHTNRIHALKIVSTLAEWSTAGKVKPADFENNFRFIRICSLLTAEGNKNNNQTLSESRATVKSRELEMILNVAGEDESAKLIQNLALSQMVKVLSSLAHKKTRSLSLLRNLSYGIGSSSQKLNLKECSDVFYALTILNYHDGMLMTRISMDVIANLEGNEKIPAAPVGSIITSVGFLKFKDIELLNALTKWVLQHQELCRPKDLASLCETLAIVNHQTIYGDEIKKKLLPAIVREDFPAADWLDYVWSLSALDLFESSHLNSVLKPEFIQALVVERGPALNTTMKKKLLNINAVAKTIATNYDGPLLKSEGSVYEIPFGYNKSKQTLVDGLLDTLKKLFADQSQVESNIDTRMGFVIDAACVLDRHRTPVKDKSNLNNAFRIAFIVLDFHDLCQGTVNEPNGISALAIKLLKRQGYTVLSIPHTEFNTSDKIIKRVQYLDEKLKSVVSGNI